MIDSQATLLDHESSPIPYKGRRFDRGVASFCSEAAIIEGGTGAMFSTTTTYTLSDFPTKIPLDTF